MRWTRGHVLGRGSSATVSAATSATGELFAVKTTVLSHSDTLQREQQFLSILNSPFIISYKGCDITKEKKKIMYNLMMQYMPGGTVIDAINGQLNEAQISNYTKQVLQGLVYIHSNNIVHCDIKGANLLVNESGVKIADFGCAKWANEHVPLRGTPMFMAPEMARGEEQGLPADIWALGCTVIEMATGCSPWLNVTDPVSLLYKIGFSGELPEIPGGFSSRAKDFIGKCLIRDPKARWGAIELLKHPFIERLDCEIGEDLWAGSPTGILDQYVWNSIGDSQSMGGDLIQPMCSSFSLRQRIEQLEGNSDVANWRWKMEEEINWMTIRSNGGGGVVEDD